MNTGTYYNKLYIHKTTQTYNKRSYISKLTETEANCAGPPDGYDEKALRARVMFCTTVRHDNKPSCTHTYISACGQPAVICWLQVKCPNHYSKYSSRASSVTGPTAWNSLPKDMRDPECSVDSYSHWRHFYFCSTTLFSTLEVCYENALY